MIPKRFVGWTTLIVATLFLRNIQSLLSTGGALTIETAPEGYLAMFLTLALLRETLGRLNRYLDQRYPWMADPVQRAWWQFGLTIPVTIVCLTGFGSVIAIAVERKADVHLERLVRELIFLNITGVLIAILLGALDMGILFLRQWQRLQSELEQFKQEHAEFQLQILKDQINPHFLFNSLTTLSSLIYVNQDDASKFVRQLAKVYRFVLEYKEKEVIALETELSILQAYLDLTEARFGENLTVQIQVEAGVKTRGIPPMTLQTLIENAIKHNIASQTRPLHIRVFVEAPDYLVVQNTLQRIANSAYASRIGLNNVIARYQYVTPREVIFDEAGGKFTVKLPLLDEVKAC